MIHRQNIPDLFAEVIDLKCLSSSFKIDQVVDVCSRMGFSPPISKGLGVGIGKWSQTFTDRRPSHTSQGLRIDLSDRPADDAVVFIDLRPHFYPFS
jgi:hypothetical protein